MFNRYNIYHSMLRAAAGDPPSGGDVEDDSSSSANAPTINMDDDPDKKPDPVVEAADEEVDGKKPGEDSGGTEPPRKPPVMVPRDSILRRVGDLTKDKKNLTGEVERLQRENAALMAAKGDDKANPPETPPQRDEFKSKAEFDAAVARAAQQQLDAREFDRRCNAVADAGETAFKADWNESVANLRMLGDDGNIPKLLLDAALEADDPAQALHHLGQNPDEALRILSLPGVQQIAAVVKHGVKKAVPKPAVQRSKTPEPPEPIAGAGGMGDDEGLSDDVDDETWLKNRQTQVQAASIAEYQRTRGR